MSARSKEAILARPGNDKEQAWAHGYKTVTKGLREHTAYRKRNHHNHADYMRGKADARRDGRTT